jgi:two-component system invasion response regulator UvrY
MKNITILVADDHTLTREIWSSVLNSDSRFHVIGSAAVGDKAVRLITRYRPDIVLIDVTNNGLQGEEIIREVRKASSKSKILVLSPHSQPVYVKKAMRSGASGYLTKNSSWNEMTDALIEIYNGKKYLCNEVKNILAEKSIADEDEKTGINSLSERELEIISFIKQGLPSREIAKKLDISTKTVEVHRYNILKKLQLKNTASLVNFINLNLPGFGNLTK